MGLDKSFFGVGLFGGAKSEGGGAAGNGKRRSVEVRKIHSRKGELYGWEIKKESDWNHHQTRDVSLNPCTITLLSFFLNFYCFHHIFLVYPFLLYAPKTLFFHHIVFALFVCLHCTLSPTVNLDALPLIICIHENFLTLMCI